MPATGLSRVRPNKKLVRRAVWLEVTEVSCARAAHSATSESVPRGSGTLVIAKPWRKAVLGWVDDGCTLGV